MNNTLPIINAEVEFFENAQKKLVDELIIHMYAESDNLRWLWDISKVMYVKAEQLYEIFPSDTDKVGRKLLNILTSELETKKESYADFKLFNICEKFSKKYSIDLLTGGFILDIPTVSTFLVVFTDTNKAVLIDIANKKSLSSITESLKNVFELFKDNRITLMKNETNYYQWNIGEHIFAGWNKMNV